MRIRFQKLKDLLDQYDETNFANLIFQSVNPDAQGNRDEYDLNAFVIRGNRSINFEITDKEDLQRDPNFEYHRKNANKIALANYHLSRAEIVAFREEDEHNSIEYLSFIPDDYADSRYVSYKIIPRNFQGRIDMLLDAVLNPSPPADPQ
jgi:hypothetical protein